MPIILAIEIITVWKKLFVSRKGVDIAPCPPPKYATVWGHERRFGDEFGGREKTTFADQIFEWLFLGKKFILKPKSSDDLF